MSAGSTCFPNSILAAVLVLWLAAVPGSAQTRPCGRPQVRIGDSPVEIRFFPLPVEHVRASLLRALPTLSARPNKEKDGVIEAKIDSAIAGSASAVVAQSKGVFYIEISPAKQGGANGAVLRIDSSGMGKYATALADEVACLANLLSPVDPSSSPRGQTSVSPPSSAREVSVPATTGVKVALRNQINSKEPSAEPALEVVEDVAVDGVTVFRKGALAKGKLTDVTTAKSFARGGSLQIALESATAVDGQQIAIEGGSLKAQGQYKPGVAQQSAASEVMAGGLVGGLLGGLMTKGYEALLPAGSTFEAQVAQPVKVRAEPEPGRPAGSSQPGPVAGQSAAAGQSDPPPGLNLDGLWYLQDWGQLKLLQAAGEREVIGRAEGYDVDGVVTGTHVVLHYTSEGKVAYSVELTPKGDGNTLSGQWTSGQARAGSKPNLTEMSRVLSVSPPIGVVESGSSAGLNVDGAWYSRDWGTVKLTQAVGQLVVVGKAEGHDVEGFVSGTRVLLSFSSKGNVKYWAELTPQGDGALSGRYAAGDLLANSATKPTEMSKALSASPPAEAGKSDSSPALNVDGTWYTHDWGTIKLTQAAGQQEVTGKTRGWDIGGFVSGKRVVLYFKSSGIVYYSAELTPKGDDALSGPYATGQLSGSPKTKEIELTRRK